LHQRVAEQAARGAVEGLEAGVVGHFGGWWVRWWWGFIVLHCELWLRTWMIQIVQFIGLTKPTSQQSIDP
jgi:hypothetical protein